MPHEIFRSKTRAPVTFTLGGDQVEYRDDGQGGATVEKVGDWEETFTVVGVAPPETVVRILSVVRTDTHGRASWQIPSLIAYVQEVLIEAHRPRWSALMSDQNRVVDGQTLGDLVEWLNEELFGRPLLRAGGSPDGAGSTGT